MKKKDVLNLIKYHVEKKENAFRDEAYNIAKYFDNSGDTQLAEYIMSLLESFDTFSPQSKNFDSIFLEKVEIGNDPLPLPSGIQDKIIGLINAIGYGVGINKFLFEGKPGTGKTETAKQVARILERTLYSVNFNALIDSKLGQTSKNISELFREISSIVNPIEIVVLFDEIDALAIDRINSNDLREMGRVTSTFLKELDTLNDKVVLIATTNLYNVFDKALSRRFDAVISFNNYTREDLINIGITLLSHFLTKFKHVGKNVRLFKKILESCDEIPYPGELKNLIKTSLAFSDPSSEFDYLKKLYESINNKKVEIKTLQQEGYTLREIEIITGVSKSSASRELKGRANHE